MFWAITRFHNSRSFRPRLIISNISNYDDIDLNDEVYTSTLGSIKDKIYVGKVNKISSLATEKIIYVKSNVDIKDVNYLYVVGKSWYMFYLIL